ncbi:MAG: hypothetical protein IJ071_00005 [Ruminococcus sp.]|nr:hypothetical protein [Ruminococcus sp.]
MGAVILFRNTTGTDVEEHRVLSFTFRKEAYTPYTSLSARFAAPSPDPTTVTEVLFYLDSRLIHHGIVDSYTVTRSGGSYIGVLRSRSFTSMLLQNQMEPGLYTGISLNRLMDDMIHIPYVTHEEDTDESGYIFVKYGSDLWEAVANFSYKKQKTYPYIRRTNCVMMTPYPQPETFAYASGELLSTGSRLKLNTMVSSLHMEDLNGDFGTYDLTDQAAQARQIVRHRYFELDRQYLYQPQEALEFRDKYAARGWRKDFCTYSGYKGEDLCDLATFGGISGRRITSIGITGSSSGIVTEIGTYRDRFYT